MCYSKNTTNIVFELSSQNSIKQSPQNMYNKHSMYEYKVEHLRIQRSLYIKYCI